MRRIVKMLARPLSTVPLPVAHHQNQEIKWGTLFYWSTVTAATVSSVILSIEALDKADKNSRKPEVKWAGLEKKLAQIFNEEKREWLGDSRYFEHTMDVIQTLIHHNPPDLPFDVQDSIKRHMHEALAWAKNEYRLIASHIDSEKLDTALKIIRVFVNLASGNLLWPPMLYEVLQDIEKLFDLIAIKKSKHPNFENTRDDLIHSLLLAALYSENRQDLLPDKKIHKIFKECKEAVHRLKNKIEARTGRKIQQDYSFQATHYANQELHDLLLLNWQIALDRYHETMMIHQHDQKKAGHPVHPHHAAHLLPAPEAAWKRFKAGYAGNYDFIRQETLTHLQLEQHKPDIHTFLQSPAYAYCQDKEKKNAKKL